MLTVYEFCNLCTESGESITICDLANDDVEDVFCGSMWDAMLSDYANCEVLSYDFWDGKITLNIDTSEE